MNKAPIYKVYLADVSYFSGKLESYLRYKQIPYERIEMNAQTGVDEVYENTGMLKVPAVKTPNGEWLKDTTPMIDWFEAQHPETSIIPKDPALAFISKLVEDYADEWCWRTAMYFRWRDAGNARYLGRRIGQEVLSGWPVPTWLAGGYFRIRQTRTFLYNDGLSSETEATIRQQYYDLMESFKLLLADQKFLLGDKASLVDIAMMGPFYRHYFCDPEPAKIMRDEYPEVLEWVVRVWNAKHDGESIDNSLANFNHVGWHKILEEIVKVYLPYLKLNAESWQKGLKHFDYEVNGVTFKRLPVIRYRVLCLETLEQLYNQLSDSTQVQVGQILSAFGSFDLTTGIKSGLSEEFKLPLAKRQHKVSLFEKLIIMTRGTPWDMRKPFQSLRNQ